MINWNDIIGGCIGFEKLAREYVKSEFQFPYGEWKETPQTRDGNKDAYTVIIGYHPYADLDETWWMEAKYSSSEKRTYLTRFRLDATIVSSVFYKRVSKIIFVTNIEIHAKTISDIRIALQRAIGCQEVYFSTRQVLEYWLLQRPDIYRDFFPPPMPPANTEKALFVSEDISVYPYPGNTGYVEPCTYLYLGKTYHAYFKVISSSPCEVALSPVQKGIKIEEKKLRLSRGENAVCVPFRLTEKFKAWSVSEDGRESQRLDLFRMGPKCSVLLKTPLEVLQNTEFRLAIQTQGEILSQLRNAVQMFRGKYRLKVSALYGASGTGKSYIVHQFMAQRFTNGKPQYYYNFTEDAAGNAKHLLQLVFFLIFPYVNPDEIDSEYLREIGEHAVITRDLMELVACQDSPNQLEQRFQQHCEKCGQIFPDQCELNQRYVFLDNIQNLDAIAWQFLLSIIQESSRKSCPFFFLLIGQPHMLESSAFLRLRQSYQMDMYDCKLEATDIIKNIHIITSFDLSNYSEVIGDYFPNLIVLLSFLKFVKASAISELRDLNDFLTLYIAFINGNLGEALILDQFANIMSDKTLKELCFSVYTAPNGIAVEGNDKAAVSALLQSGLIKLNDQNQLIPFHDIYEGIFRRAYRISKRELGLPYTDVLEETRDNILFPASASDVVLAANQITKLRKDGHFYSVCYILDSYFEQERSSGTLKDSPYSDTYYQMYFDYAYAAVNCSHKHTGYDYFEKIYSEIENKTSTPMRLLKMELLFELMNSNYNIFRFKEAMRRYQQFQATMNLLVRTKQLPPCRVQNEMYVLCENMRILIQSSRGKKKSEQMFLRWREVLKRESYHHHYIDFLIRYAHTLYTIDPHRALQYTEEARSCLPDEDRGTSKLWCLVEFQYLYLRLLLNREYTILAELEAVADAARKNYYSSFRHRNMALCAVLYAIGDVQKADERFLKDMAYPRQLRDKLRGFYFETLALHYLSHGDSAQAADALGQAAEVFRNVPGYLRTIRHNQKVLRFERFSLKRIDYNLGGALRRDWYYIDPRAD